MKYTFIGDIHSASDDLETLLKSDVITNSKLIFIGDYIDGIPWQGRDNYYFDKPTIDHIWHKNLLNKVIVSGHTPVQTLGIRFNSYAKMQYDSSDTPRYLIDSGSRSGLLNGGITALTLDELGNKISVYAVIENQIYSLD